MRKLTVVLALLLALGGSISAQLSPAPSSTGSITTNGATCAVTNACIVLHLASSNVGYSVAVSGTWTGTLTIEQSADNQTSWATATTTTANTLFSSALAPGITDARVRGSAAMTGTAVVTITASGPATIQNITQAGGGASSPSSAGQLDPTQAPYNAKFDVGSLTGSDGSVTSGQGTFSSTNKTCSTGDNGKLIIVVVPASGAYPFGTGLVTVTGCSGNSWTTTGSSNTTAGSLNWAIGSSGNGAALSAAYSAALTARKILALPCGTGIVDTTPFPSPSTLDYLTQHPDIAGCNATGGTGFIFHPQMSAVVLAAGGGFFAGFPCLTSPTTGSISATGLGGQNKVENLFLTSLGGLIPGTGGRTYNLFGNFNVINNIAIQLFGLSAGTLNVISNTCGENHIAKLNFQNFTTGATYNGVFFGGQGANLVSDSIFANSANFTGVSCNSGSFCALENSYCINNSMCFGASSGSGNILRFVGNTCSVTGGSGSFGCFFDNGGTNTTMWAFANIIGTQQTNFPAITVSSGSVLDISGSTMSSQTSGFIVAGAGTLNDRAGNSWATPLTQFTGKYVPIGGGSVANNSVSAATNFGANLGSTNVLGGVSPGAATYDIKIGFRQTLAGVGCGAGSNTVNGVLSWTSGGVTQSTGSGGVPALGTLTISANGSVGSSSVYISQPVHIDINTQVTFTTTSVLASAGCSTVPQYVVDFSNI